MTELGWAEAGGEDRDWKQGVQVRYLSNRCSCFYSLDEEDEGEQAEADGGCPEDRVRGGVRESGQQAVDGVGHQGEQRYG